MPGELALKQHWNETKKMNFLQKKMFSTMGYKHKKLSENPCILSLTVDNRHIQKTTFVQLLLDEIIDALALNGAEKDKDFLIEVSDGDAKN